ncbi:MAG: hypothetical protein KGH72_03535 [Candidatus Micrarchaeota archaeon]|nr:hypothetical protein [Candidatus Micrarchaeota archaeon]
MKTSSGSNSAKGYSGMPDKTIAKRLKGKSRLQAALEYLTTYSFAIIIILVFLGIIALLALTGHSNGISTETPSACYITAQLTCSQFVVASTSTGSEAILIFVNNMGQNLSMPAGSFIVKPAITNATYVGSCYPSTATPGTPVTCVATSKYKPPLGSQLNLAFQLYYNNFHVTGTSTTYASPNTSAYGVLLTSNVRGGGVSINDFRYANGSNVIFLKGVNYNIAADAPPGYGFLGWIPGGGVSIPGSGRNSTVSSANAAANGTIEAVFGLPSTSSSSSSTSSTTTTSGSAVSLTLESASDPHGQSDLATGTTSVSGDTVVVKYCAGTTCVPSTTLFSGTGTAAGDVGSLIAGTYTLEACDTNNGMCSSTQVLTITSSPPAASLTLQNTTSPYDITDNAKGTTSNSVDTVAVHYCAGTGCNPTTVLATGTGTATYNVGLLAPGLYTLNACDTSVGGCSISQMLNITYANGVSLTIQYAKVPQGYSDNVTASTVHPGHNVVIYICDGAPCTPSLLIASGTNNATYNMEAVGDVNVYDLQACDTNIGVCSPVSAINVTATYATVNVTLQRTTIHYGQSDIATAMTSVHNDSVSLYYCAGNSMCSSGEWLNGDTWNTSFNVDVFYVGNYTFWGYDGDATNETTNTVHLTVLPASGSSPSNVTLNLQYYSINVGQSDIGTGTTSIAGDPIAINYCNNCTVVPHRTLSKGNGTTTYNFKTFGVGKWLLDACDNSTGVCSGIKTLYVGTSISVTLSIQNPSVQHGQSDIATGTTSNSTDTIVLYDCGGGGGCSPDTTLATGTGTVTYNLGNLPVNQYNIQACDTTIGDCTAPQGIDVILTASNVTFSLQRSSDPQGQSDTATGTTNVSSDGIQINYCAGTGCTPSTTLATGTGTVAHNVGTFTPGVYTLDACDQVTGSCSSTTTLTITTTTPTVTIGLQSATDPHGTTDTATGMTTNSGDNIVLNYCAGTGCTPSAQLNSGTGTVTYNVGTLVTGTYTLDACDTTYSICSSTTTLTIT